MEDTNYSKLVALVGEMTDDANKFYNKNNTTAGTRLRKHFLQVKQLAHAGRKEVQEKINSVKEERKTARVADDGGGGDGETKVTKKSKKAKGSGGEDGGGGGGGEVVASSDGDGATTVTKKAKKAKKPRKSKK